MRSTDNEFTTDNKVTDNVVDKDKDFSPRILIRNIEKNLICKKSIENYVKKKKRNILSILSNILDVKLNNICEVFIKANKSTVCLWTEWVQHVGLALQKCYTVSEKIKILILLPSSLTKNETSSLFPDITILFTLK